MQLPSIFPGLFVIDQFIQNYVSYFISIVFLTAFRVIDVSLFFFFFFFNFPGFSPRLCLNRTVRITIKDNDDPQGVLSFRNPRITASENSSRAVELEIQRTQGTFGDVSVLVRTVGGGEGWSPTMQSLKEAIAAKTGERNATAGPDYVQLSTRVNFPVRLP